MPIRPPCRAVASAAIGAWLCGVATLAFAQPRGGGPDVADFALAWARGGFVSPVVCRFGERAERGLRRVIIEPGPRTSERRVDRVKFVDLAAPGAERCTDELGTEEPNVVGTILISYTLRRPRSDTPERDFKHELERGAIEFEVVHGRLRMGPAGGEAAALPERDFEGGKLSLATIRPGSDDARRVADLPGARALRLEVAAKDGTRFAFALVELERR